MGANADRGAPKRALRERLEADERFETLLTTVQELLPTFGPQAAANTLWALAKLRHMPAHSLRAELVSSISKQMAGLWPQNVANCLWASSVLQLGQDSGLPQALTTQATRQAASLSQ